MDSEAITPTVDYFTDDVKPPIQPMQIATLIFYGLVFLLGVPGNALVMWVTGFGMSRTVTSIWFLNLSLADFLCCLCLPFLMVPLAQDDHWDFGPVACTLLKSVFYLVMYCSILQLVLISVDRCMLVTRPVWCQNNRRPRLAVQACGAAWVLALLATVPELIFTREVVHLQKTECYAVRSQLNSHIVIGFRFVFGFLLPFLAIVVSHVVVYRRASAMSGNNRSKRTLKVIIAVAASFFFCWLPLHFMNILITIIDRGSSHRPNINMVQALALCLAYFNSCINPILYVCLGREFRTSINRSLPNYFNFIKEEATCCDTTNATINTKSSSTVMPEITGV